MGRWITVLVLLLLGGPGGSRCLAHPATFASATAKVQADGRFQVEARFDLLAFALDDTTFRIGDAPMNALLDGPPDALQAQLTEARQRFQRDFQVSGGPDTPGIVDSVAFPTVADVQAWRDSGIKPRLPVLLTVTVQGHLPSNASSVSFRFPNVLGTMVVTTELPNQEPVSEPVEAGAFSSPVPLAAPPPAAVAPPPVAVKPAPHAVLLPAPKPHPAHPPAPRVSAPKSTPAMPTPLAPKPAPVPVAAVPSPAKPFPAKTAPVKPAAKSAPQAKAIPAPLSAAQATPRRVLTPAPLTRAAPPVTQRPAWGIIVFRYIKMGYAHILPEGLDHILFVLGLFLLSTRLKPLLWQITAFTVAHSLTLALALYGIVRLPPGIIEPIIAASIAFVAIENIFTTELKPWRPFVVFGFGLVHGMGFANALKDLGLHRPDFLTALLGFNVGVELGQLSVVALALLAVGWFRQRAEYRKWVVIPASCLIAAVAVFWTIQRILLYHQA